MRISDWSSDVCSSDLDFNVRGKLLFTPGDATEITLSGNYTDFDHHNVAAQNPPGAVLATGQGYLGRYKTASDAPWQTSGESYGGSLTAMHDLGGVQIRNITACQKFVGTQTIDQDVSPMPLVRGDVPICSHMKILDLHVMTIQVASVTWLAD